MNRDILIDFRKDEQAYETLLNLIKKSNTENTFNVSCEYKGITITVFTNGIVTDKQFKILDIFRNKGVINGRSRVLAIDNSSYNKMRLDDLDEYFPLSELTGIAVMIQKENRSRMSQLLFYSYSEDWDGTIEGDIASFII